MRRHFLLLLAAHHEAGTRREEDHEDQHANSNTSNASERYIGVGRIIGGDDFDSDRGHLLDRDTQCDGGVLVGGAEGGGELGLHLVSSLGGGHGDGGGDAHASGGDVDCDERLVSAASTIFCCKTDLSLSE